jgi:hypothetical protein
VARDRESNTQLRASQPTIRCSLGGKSNEMPPATKHEKKGHYRFESHCRESGSPGRFSANVPMEPESKGVGYAKLFSHPSPPPLLVLRQLSLPPSLPHSTLFSLCWVSVSVLRVRVRSFACLCVCAYVCMCVCVVFSSCVPMRIDVVGTFLILLLRDVVAPNPRCNCGVPSRKVPRTQQEAI